MPKTNKKAAAKTEAVNVAVAAEQTVAAKAEAAAPRYTIGTKTAKPGTFFARVQAAVKDSPKTLAEIISGLQASHVEDKGMVPKSKKDHDMVIRVRTNYAANHGILQEAK